MSQVAIKIVHGDIESSAEMDDLLAVGKVAEPFTKRSIGTNDTLTFHMSSLGVPKVMEAIAKHRRDWWQVTIRRQQWD